MPKKKGTVDLPLDKEEIIKDYRLAYQSRQASLIGRREVLSGKAKFGIFGDGKEIINIAIARHFRKGDWRSGYYRDQTWMFMLNVMSIQEFFAQLYAHADVEHESNTGGRSMNAHFANRFLNADGSWKNQTELYNTAADVSPTGTQMPRTVGLAYASVLYRGLDELKQFTQFSRNGNEVTWASIGNASTAEGMFWETVNAIGVLKAPAIITIYDDGYGISVPNEYQMVKGNIGDLLEGFKRKPESNDGFDLYRVRAWDYPALLETFRAASQTAREEHVPALVHVTEVTQPQGHSTSGSHERYKSPERLKFEEEFDGVHKMKAWMLENKIATEIEFKQWESEDYEIVENIRKIAWDSYLNPILEERGQVMDMLDEIAGSSSHAEALSRLKERLANLPSVARRDVHSAAHEALRILRDEANPSKQILVQWKNEQDAINEARYGSHLYDGTAVSVAEVKPAYSGSSPTMMGFEVINAAFDSILERDPRVIAFGEDVGFLGDVNQGFKGMQEKYGALRVSDTGIREATIMGQAIGLAMRGLRPICEIQYLDYILYALQIMSDDLATLHWRTAGGQAAPVIVRTRGHRLEGVWHSGSLMAGLINLLRGMNVLVPRDMTRAAGFYNTLLKSDEPAVVVEVLNGYRVKERLPDNIGEFTVPLGVPEVIREGSDVTVVTYGACCRIALDAAEKLSKVGIEVEVVDVQSLLPFDVHGMIVESLKKTNRVLFLDEDVPGGTSAYMMQEVIEKQGGYFHLDSPARTLSGKAHRPAYGSDGDYWSKPNAETIFDAVYEMMNEVDPGRYPVIK
ncbi:MAG TPA: thiamine pyrophosphate-dependent enzyme [Anaerolineales bacterium]|jgi:2-oxoisovalerate dehydrogenase E1 component|nr:thiamine pyrophosphate-dependent enzyme [Anaerolineales bacterium]HQX14909.1 thiamine pyrophosphate-dependent enzyme [Anaerolineales bacterium]